MAGKVYQISDLFFTEWKQLSVKKHAEVYTLQQKSLELRRKFQGDDLPLEYGYVLIQILKRIRKNFSLVDRINVDQAVDIYNDLFFLKKPWYFFPNLQRKHIFYKWGYMKRPSYRTPDDHLARHTFDHFIYADNEFTTYIATQDEKYLVRLAATLYNIDTDTHFDKELIDERAQLMKRTANTRELQLIFYTFGHVREFLINRCKHLLPKKPIETTEEPVKAATPTGALWYDIKHHAAQTLVFGTFSQLGAANMYDVLDHLEILAKENRPNGNT